MFPGMNLLMMANQLIGFQTAKHSRWKENVQDDAGNLTPTYYTPVEITASIQPTPKTLIATFGWDLQKNYITVYSQAKLEVADAERDRACDMLDFECVRYNVESNTPWVNQDGWKSSVCVAIGPAPA